MTGVAISESLKEARRHGENSLKLYQRLERSRDVSTLPHPRCGLGAAQHDRGGQWSCFRDTIGQWSREADSRAEPRVASAKGTL